ncbi:MAG: hypothetical protein R3350_09930, partial [Saprospiraceae bacterium]|nr:hypothetical protein [Saprospiraceae bacterium]
EQLVQFPVVLHAAGPFIHTALPMIESCLRTETHYLDITGEIQVFEMARSFNEAAREAGVMLMPGTGFDVVPTDCLALHLKDKLPDAHELKLAIVSMGSHLSHGTATTMAENLGEGGAVRKDGHLQKVALGHKTRYVPTPEGEMFVMTIPWGDLSTAYESTGIPNIEVYAGISPSAYKYVRLQKYLGWVLRRDWVRNLVKGYINRQPAGPSEERREKARSYIWGEVTNVKGEVAQARLKTPEGYTLTALCSCLITKKLLEGNAPPGFQTPARVFGADLVMEIEGVKRQDLR